MTYALAGRDGGVRGKDAGRVRIRRMRAQPRTQNRALQRGQTARAHFVGASKYGSPNLLPEAIVSGNFARVRDGSVTKA